MMPVLESSIDMKKVILILGVLVLLLSCTMNPSKESRIQHLEAEQVKTSQKMEQLEKRIDSLILEQTK